MIYFISDIHFYHENILKFEHRPFENVEEMNEYYIKVWNNKVKKGDIVYYLGDFSFSKSIEENEKLLSRLNGQKFLIKGNHDHSVVYKAKGWQGVYDYLEKEIDGKFVCMFHYPIAVWNRKHHGAKLLFGHIHSNKETLHPLEWDLGENAFNVGIDVIKEPKTLEELIQWALAKKELEK